MQIVTVRVKQWESNVRIMEEVPPSADLNMSERKLGILNFTGLLQPQLSAVQFKTHQIIECPEHPKRPKCQSPTVKLQSPKVQKQRAQPL